MNKNITKIVFLAILGVVLGYFLYTRVFSESEEDRQWREQYEADQEARESGQPAAADPGGASSGPWKAHIRDDEIDLELLAAGIKKVEFNYGRREGRATGGIPARWWDPTLRRTSELASAMVGEALPVQAMRRFSPPFRRNLLLSGIMWHPTAPVAIITTKLFCWSSVPSEMFRTARRNGLEMRSP